MSISSTDREGLSGLAWAVLLVVVAFVLGLILTFVGYEANWWFTNNSNARTTNMIRHSISAQNSYVTATENYLSTIASLNTQMSDPSISADQKAALQAQKTAVINQACPIAKKIDPSEMQPDISGFITADCASQY